MCHRHSLFPPASVLEDRFDATLAFSDYRPRYNLAPGDLQAIITGDAPDAVDEATWGLRPSGMETDAAGFVNARSETAAEKPSFRDAWASRPCLVLSSGFYEWQDRKMGTNQPFRIHRPDEPAFAMAGLWEPLDDDPGMSVTVLTTGASDVIEPVHDRMPVVLPREREASWLDASAKDRHQYCSSDGGDDLEAYPISRRVNDPTNDDPHIIDPTDDSQPGLDAFV